VTLAIQAHAYFKGIDFEALLRREIAMKPEWIPVISGDHDDTMFDPKTLKMVLCRCIFDAL
jgi:hypothetical protein